MGTRLVTKYQQQRSYGGKCGVWLRKKQRRSYCGRLLPRSLPKSSPISFVSAAKSLHVAEALATTSAESGSSSQSSGDEDEENRIGWDDDLCRPVYLGRGYIQRAVAERNGGKSVGENDGNVETNTHWKIGGRSRSYGSKKRDHPDNFPALVDGAEAGTAHDDPADPVQTNGSISGGTAMAISCTSSPLDNRSIRKREKKEGVSLKHAVRVCTEHVTSSVDVTSVNVEDAAGDATPRPAAFNEKSICSLLDSNSSKQEGNMFLGLSAKTMVPGGRNDKRGVNRPWAKGKSRVRRSGKDGVVPRDHRIDSLSFINEDLSRAKAFFENLDANHDLVIEDGSPVLTQGLAWPGIPCGRTTRTANFKCPKLQHEYGEYCKAFAKGVSSVVPLSLVEFASQRGKHFQNKSFFDGVLDSAA